MDAFTSILPIANHLQVHEMACPCCEQWAATLRLLAAWELLRARLDTPIGIVSGFRCQAHNREVKGSPRSRHLKGLAMDVRCGGVDLFSAAAFEAFIDSGFRGIGRGGGVCHLDVREDPAAFWKYAEGRAVKDEDAAAIYRGGWRGR